MEKVIIESNRIYDEAILALFKATYFIGKETLPFCKFHGLCKLLVSLNACITKKMYHDEKSYSDLIFLISSVIQKKIFDRTKDSKYFGIMKDEFTNISITSHMVVFATFIEGGMPACVFLELIECVCGKKDSTFVYNTLVSTLKD